MNDVPVSAGIPLSFGDFDPGDAITGEVTTGELSPGARSGLCELEDWSSLPYWLLEIEVYCDDLQM